jgi:hypothetical protein
LLGLFQSGGHRLQGPAYAIRCSQDTVDEDGRIVASMGFGNGIKTDFVGCDGDDSDDGDILDSLQSTVMLYLIQSNLPDFQGM